ncbi:hypothetical protein [Acinetobacter proteolyticus]|uniref:Uncharacterized protein n=1 Tax=Acinetobacter proteolyticus TaxID=1776741 RepID=A0A2N0WIG7_9GAMM|nr:hypothetical protein [Acinetobacter proteolyticus]PKF35574.1 hypothetical protein CW311_04605 [Acinetobacter proteolyticus]
MQNNLVQPPRIRYNLNERGRTHRGVERNFNIPEIVAAINSPECQEMVKTRAMLGYLGHWVRIRFGLEPSEGGIAEGKIHNIEPAFVTTYLEAFPNGDVVHQTEFLNNPTGLIAWRMHDSKVGGFSSVIDEAKRIFYGFDWVNDPNYSTNRGYALALDSVNNGAMSLDDVVAAELSDRTEAMNILLERSEYREKIALDSAARLSEENDQLLEMLAQYDAKYKAPILPDSKNEATLRMERDKATFDSTLILPRHKTEPTKEQKQSAQEYQRLRGRMGI